jgi:hypothetical protein
VGYAKAAMVFHMLRSQLGERAFHTGIRHFVATNMHQVAGWDDIRSAFEWASGENLRWFFEQWVEGAAVPRVSLSGIAVAESDEAHVIEFTLRQAAKPFKLLLPLTFEFADGLPETLLVEVDEMRRSFRAALDRNPVRVLVDRGYDVFRVLSRRELPPSVDRLMSRREIVLVGGPHDAITFEALIERLSTDGRRIAWRRPEELAGAAAQRSIIYLMHEPRSSESLGGKRRPGLAVDILRHPLQAGEVLAVARASSKAEVSAAAERLLSGREYGRAAFDEGQWTRFVRATADRGMIAYDRSARGKQAAHHRPGAH